MSKDFGAVLAPSVAPASAPPKRSIRSENEGLYRDGKAEKDSKPLQVCEDKQISARELNLTDGLERARSSRSKGRKLAGYVPIETTQIFAENNVNMVKLESRPVHSRPWEYLFYIDFIGSTQEETVRKALDHLSEYALMTRVLSRRFCMKDSYWDSIPRSLVR